MLLENGYKVVIMDNLRNSFIQAYEHMKRIAGDKADNMKFVKVKRCGDFATAFSSSCAAPIRRVLSAINLQPQAWSAARLHLMQAKQQTSS